MKKEDHQSLEQEFNQPDFSDSDYSEDMRVDTLTTMDAIHNEIENIDSTIKEARANAIAEAEGVNQEPPHEDVDEGADTEPAE